MPAASLREKSIRVWRHEGRQQVALANHHCVTVAVGASNWREQLGLEAAHWAPRTMHEGQSAAVNVELAARERSKREAREQQKSSPSGEQWLIMINGRDKAALFGSCSLWGAAFPSLSLICVLFWAKKRQ